MSAKSFSEYFFVCGMADGLASLFLPILCVAVFPPSLRDWSLLRELLMPQMIRFREGREGSVQIHVWPYFPDLGRSDLRSYDL